MSEYSTRFDFCSLDEGESSVEEDVDASRLLRAVSRTHRFSCHAPVSPSNREVALQVERGRLPLEVIPHPQLEVPDVP